MKKFCALLAVVALVAFAAPAFASNPFMDVPMNHWAYDAVGQLAARGIVSGYPDGTYKGNQPITRYEMASVIARGLAVIDMDKASKQDVEMLKRLVVEFKDELDALGVKVDKIDSRLAVMEENLGGWKLWGEFRFDVKYGDKDNNNPAETSLYGINKDTRWNVSRYRIWMRKKVDDKVTFTARIGNNGGVGSRTDLKWDRYWIDVALPWDVNMMAGRWLTDWEDSDGLYVDNDALFTDRTLNGFYFSKAFGMGEFAAYATHGDERDGTISNFNQAGYEYGARVRFNFNEQFWLSLNGIMWKTDEAHTTIAGVEYDKAHAYWAAAGLNINPNIGFRVAYYDVDRDAPNTDGNLFKAILDVKQDVLKFTSVWLEYAKISDNFQAVTDGPFNMYGDVSGTDLSVYDNYYFIYLNQKWNDKWSTFQRYMHGSAAGTGPLFDDTKNYSFGVKYFYTPALSFELVYDKIENGSTVAGQDDSLVRFRTHVKF